MASWKISINHGESKMGKNAKNRACINIQKIISKIEKNFSARKSLKSKIRHENGECEISLEK